MPITFCDSEEMSEYINQKFREGYECEAKKVSKSKWRVWVIGKRARTEPKLMATEKLEKAMSSSYRGDLKETYERLGGWSAKSPRTSQDVARIAYDEFHKAGLYNVEVHVTPNYSYTGQSDAAVLPPEVEKAHGGIPQPWLVFIHSIHEYTDEDYLREVVRHEIKHVKKEVK